MSGIGNVSTRFFEFGSPEEPFELENGGKLTHVRLAYETYGKLDERRDNAVLVLHALSGSHHAAGFNRVNDGSPLWTDECQVGWWDAFIGPGKVIDTGKYFVICVNYLGSCYGSTGPASLDPETGKPYGSRFPDITINDIVRSQLRLLDHLGIPTLLAAIGGSMGGMMAMDLALHAPERIRSVIPIAACHKTSALTKVHNFEQMFALQEDPNFNRGDYYDGPRPRQGLILARMISHKTFVSLRVMEQRARGHIIQNDDDLKGYRMRHQLESYMLYQGKKFAQRFDANSYVRILTAWQDFDLARRYGGGDLNEAFRRSSGHHYQVYSIDSDVCFYPEEQAEIVAALKACDISRQYVTVHSEKGHDSFLVEPELYVAGITWRLADSLRQARKESRAMAPPTRANATK